MTTDDLPTGNNARLSDAQKVLKMLREAMTLATSQEPSAAQSSTPEATPNAKKSELKQAFKEAIAETRPASRRNEPSTEDGTVTGDKMGNAFVSRIAEFFRGLMDQIAGKKKDDDNNQKREYDRSEWGDPNGERDTLAGSNRERRAKAASSAAESPGSSGTSPGVVGAGASTDPRHSYANQLLSDALKAATERPKPSTTVNRKDTVWQRGAERVAQFGEKWGKNLHTTSEWLTNEIGGQFGSRTGRIVDSFGQFASRAGKTVRAASGIGKTKETTTEATAGRVAGTAARAGVGSIEAGEMEAGAAGGPIGLAFAAVAVAATETTAAFVKVISSVKDFGDGLLQAKRQQAQVNGTMALAYAQLDAQRYGRMMRNANDTADTTSELARSQNRLEDATTPWRTAADNVLNKVTQLVEDGISTLVEQFNELEVVKAVLWFCNWKTKTKGPDGNQWFRDMVKQAETNAKRRSKPVEEKK